MPSTRMVPTSNLARNAPTSQDGVDRKDKRAEAPPLSAPHPIVSVDFDAGARLPAYASEGSAGADLTAHIDGTITIPPGGRAMVPTGLHLEIPKGYEGQVRPRSGLAFEHGVTVLNSPGTIDSDYRGEVRIILINHGDMDFHIASGDRVAQLIVSAIERADFVASDSLGETERGSGGFGSTGVSG